MPSRIHCRKKFDNRTKIRQVTRLVCNAQVRPLWTILRITASQRRPLQTRKDH
jgi:hypothetical protein